MIPAAPPAPCRAPSPLSPTAQSTSIVAGRGFKAVRHRVTVSRGRCRRQKGDSPPQPPERHGTTSAQLTVQITLFGHGTGGRSGDQVAAHIGYRSDRAVVAVAAAGCAAAGCGCPCLWPSAPVAVIRIGAEAGTASARLGHPVAEEDGAGGLVVQADGVEPGIDPLLEVVGDTA